MARSRTKVASIPTSLEELVEFFDTHDMGEYWEKMPEAQFEIDIKKRRHLVAIDEKLVPGPRRIAKSKKVSSEDLVNEWVREKVAVSKKTLTR